MKSAIKPPRQRHITIRIMDGRALIPKHVAGLVKAALTPRSNKFKYKRRELPTDIWFVQKDRFHGWCIPMGLLHRVVWLLQRNGYSVQIEYEHREQLTADDLSGRTAADGRFDRRALEAAMRYSRGHFRVRRVADTLPLVIDLALLFADWKILVVVKSFEAANQAAALIRQQVKVPVSSGPGYVPLKRAHIHVVCLANFMAASVYGWDVVIVADGDAAVSLTAAEQGMCMVLSRVYAIVPVQQRLDLEDQLRLEVLSGPDLCPRQPYNQHATAVEVWEVEPGGYPPKRRRDPLERKRVNIWHHEPRNQQVADIALTLRTLDPYKLRTMGMDGSPTVNVFQAAEVTPRVAVVVDVPEHARALRRLLPGWKALDLTNTPAHAELWVDCEQTIITRSLARRAGIVADVIIRATGVEESWDKSYGPFALLHKPNMLVIDIMDNFDAEAEKASHFRSQEYQELGW